MKRDPHFRRLPARLYPRNLYAARGLIVSRPGLLAEVLCKPRHGYDRCCRNAFGARTISLLQARLYRRPGQVEIARRALPNDPRLFELTGYILRRRGRRRKVCAIGAPR